MKTNTPDMWRALLPVPNELDHKYSRGQVAVLGGREMAGAACLTALSASRVGAGLVMIVSPFFDFSKDNKAFDPIPAYHAFSPHLIVREGCSFMDVVRQAERKGICVPVIGPGLGNESATIRRIVIAALKRGKPIVLDADALNAFEGHRQELFDEVHEQVILTPHEGEFFRLFPELKSAGREVMIGEATGSAAGVWVLKGAKTLIASKRGQVIENIVSSPYLATAGAGDVLAGILAGLVAQGMPVFEAVCAGVWIHGRAGQIFGPGLIATDLPHLIPQVLQEVLGFPKKLG